MRLDSEVIPIRERSAMLFLRCGRLDVEDGALVLVEQPLTEDAGGWQVKVEYRLLGLLPQSAEATLFTGIGEKA